MCIVICCAVWYVRPPSSFKRESQLTTHGPDAALRSAVRRSVHQLELLTCNDTSTRNSDPFELLIAANVVPTFLLLHEGLTMITAVYLYFFLVY
jgi:hypothetical protein